MCQNIMSMFDKTSPLLLHTLGTRSHPRELHFVSCACDGCFPAAASCCLMVVTVAAAAASVVKRAFGCINEHAFVAVLLVYQVFCSPPFRAAAIREF